MLIQRILAAIILLPLVVVALFYAPFSIFVYIIILICGLAAFEWAQFLALTKKQSKLLFALGVVVFLGILYFLPFPIELKSKIYISIMSLSIVWWLLALILVLSYPNSAKYWRNSFIAKLLFAFFTLIPFFIGMIQLRAINYPTNSYTGAFLLLYVFVLVWATDTGAYFVGRSLGKHKLSPKVSPGKTLEGFLGGVIVAVVISLIIYATNFFTISFTTFIISSLFAIFVSALGDLTESMFKREAGIKDSGNLIPGHGGVLDRIDSLTAAVPIFATLSLHLL
ncbi:MULTISPECIES: phosphatidate cytidylyltransferase [unclassified Gilliamella]|uniref:phosphatidate cytidylyltransferase n=1 Tax=unclassified Gilliamella TaxID=2685620 RepID=UPI001C699C58|nr:phosphatidate cytidylyltransferase [Gilliamella sp. ESL0441]QYN43681.1 phosphatidate cytidylyltransferase [Gilliamella sp. ESL0441]